MVGGGGGALYCTEITGGFHGGFSSSWKFTRFAVVARMALRERAPGERWGGSDWGNHLVCNANIAPQIASTGQGAFN